MYVKYKLIYRKFESWRALWQGHLWRFVGLFTVIREKLHRQVGENIKRAQKIQQRHYGSRNESSASNDIFIGAEVLLRNSKRKDLKGGEFTFK